jgi:multiple sugar transport system permease protein
MNSRKKKVGRIFYLYIPLIVIAIVVLIPFLWALSTSLKTIPEFTSETIKYLPQKLNFDNYVYVWTKSGFSRYFLNSIFVSFVSVIVIAVLCVCNGYALSRYSFWGKNFLVILLLGTQMMPVILYIVPLFSVFKNLRLIDTPAALIIFNILLQTPFNTLLMRSFVNGIPKDIDEAAMVDGAGRCMVITKIILPLLKPGLVAVTAFAFIGCWNEFLVSFTFIQTQKKFTIPVGLKSMIGEYSVNYPALAAGSIIALIPPVILFAIIQKHLISGLSTGAVKG